MVTLFARRGVLLAALLTTSIAVFVSQAYAAPQIDPSFGKSGFAAPSVFPKNKKLQRTRGLAFQSDGKLVLPMTLPISFGHRSRRPVIRLNADGSRDRSYGKSGVAWVRASGAPFITLRGAKITPGDGTLIWGEYFFEKDRLDPDGIFVTKLSASGAVDRSFGDDGARRFSLHIPGHDTDLIDVSAAGDGGVVVSLETYSLKRERDTVRTTRLDSAGKIDRSFGKNGTKAFTFERRTSLAAVSSGVLVAGDSLYMSLSVKGNCVVHRYLLRGSVPLDPTFGTNGQAKLRRGCGGGISATATGGVLVYGERFEDKTGPSGSVQRLRAEGTLDATFGRGGSVEIPSIDFAARAVELPGGGVLVSGWCAGAEAYYGCLSVVDASGVPTVSFGKSGTMKLAKYVFGAQLAAGGASVAALLENDVSTAPAPTQIIKFTN